MTKPSQDDIITEGVSIGNMSSEEVDTFLSQIVAEDDRCAKAKEPDAGTAGQSSPEIKGAAIKAGKGKADSKAAAVEVESTLDQVDAQLADLEALLAEATGSEEDDASASDAQPPVTKQEHESRPGDVQAHEEALPAADVSMPAEDAGQKAADEGPGSRKSPSAEPVPGEDVVTVSEETTTPEQPRPLAGESAATGARPMTESPAAAEETIRSETASDATADAADHPVVARRNRLRTLPADLVTATIKLLIRVLTIVDLPFAGLGRALKNLFGYIAIATLFVSAGTWIVGIFLRGGS